PPSHYTHTLSLHDALPIYLRGIRAGGRVAIGFTLFILAPFALFVLLGAPRLGAAAVTPLVAEGKEPLPALGLALMFGMWCYNTLDRKSTRLNSSHGSISYA